MKVKRITKYWSISDKQKKKLDLIKNKEKTEQWCEKNLEPFEEEEEDDK